MAEIIIHTLTTSKSDIFRIREFGFFEKIGGYKYVIELLVNGAFKPYRDKYFHKEEEANDYINKIYNLDVLYKRRMKAQAKLKPDFEESIRGTKEYDFYQMLELLEISDYKLDFENHDYRAICTVPKESSFEVNEFLRKHGFPTSIKSIEIEVRNDGYGCILKTYSGDHCLFFSLHYDEESDYDQYNLLFESKLRTSY